MSELTHSVGGTLQEYTGGRCVSYRVNARGGLVEVVADVYALDFFKEQGDAVISPTSPSTSTSSSSTRRMWRRVQVSLERILLPDGYPNSVTDDLLAFALWDQVQVLASNATAALSMRAVLLGVGVGESKANLTSSTLSWMMRDGVRMMGSIVFASLISQGLEYRAKTWRLVADIASDFAGLLELCAPWLPGGQVTFRSVVIFASVIKALVGVCSSGTHESFTQHFALRNNAADVAAKETTRGNVGSFIGLFLGIYLTYLVPATSALLNLVVYALCTALHIFANYRGVRGVRLRRLNAPHLEWCLEEYCAFKDQELVAIKKESAPRSVMPILDLSPRRANAAERLFILPALRALPPLSNSVFGSVYRFFRRHCYPTTLTLRMHCGASLLDVLRHQKDPTTLRRHKLVQQVESSLATRGIALLVDNVDMTYYMILPEYFTVEGVPESWVRYKRQYDAGLRHMKTKERQVGAAASALPGTAAAAAAAAADWDDLDEGRRTEQAETLMRETAEIERLQREHVAVPPHILSLVYRQLWAFFYAFMHCRAVRLRREGRLARTSGVLKHPHKKSSAEGQRIHIINALRADGMLDESHDDASPARYSPVEFEQMTSPTSTTSSMPPRNTGFPPVACGVADRNDDGAAESVYDGLHPQFIEFVRALRTSGWELDRLLINTEGYTTVVHYL
ncbi:hypothetical protein JKF63_05140 [Porcisia hertigi]|uniref:Protein root UVB sensitive/RUS domain-containing protein n=1 Tax=Porcisia hertigi TaxID=2761500 RepID=A0A836LBJ0_9TRYP|nr:hypothetical protein JKF63_05140 [Porcisia hertigi]